MKEADQNVISTVPEHAGSPGDGILKDTKNMPGNMPFMLPVQREQRPDPFALACPADDILCRPPNLSGKTARDGIFDKNTIAALLERTVIPGLALRASCNECPRDTGMRQVSR